MPEPWPSLIAFSACVLALYWLQRWITQHVQGIGILLFNSRNAAMGILWMFLLPGIVIHELSHWVMAKLLGLKTGRFRIWPQVVRDDIVLGSVEVKQGNHLVDSVVGLAPFLGGTVALLVIGYGVFDASALGSAWEQGAWRQSLDLLAGTLQVADSWLWLYLMLAISNAMMPSPTDRASWRVVVIYLGLVSVVLLLLGWSPALPPILLQRITAGLRTLLYAFGLALLIDAIFALGLLLLEFVLSLIRGGRVVYK